MTSLLFRGGVGLVSRLNSKNNNATRKSDLFRRRFKSSSSPSPSAKKSTTSTEKILVPTRDQLKVVALRAAIPVSFLLLCFICLLRFKKYI